MMMDCQDLWMRYARTRDVWRIEIEKKTFRREIVRGGGFRIRACRSGGPCRLLFLGVGEEKRGEERGLGLGSMG